MAEHKDAVSEILRTMVAGRNIDPSASDTIQKAVVKPLPMD